ncbi:plasmid mobilization protein [Acidisphaera sp. S103]|uniref:plasmid mobilization protein n=1 Tax=Acidisphaera sp. S103 TaxID=1747223 RepID=UPI00131D716D|nr:plasmid mobilization relaxosome protein MobC [Acidisphaera sp. S103]
MARYGRAFDGERRTAFLGVQLTPTERAALEADAKRQGAQVSAYARELMFRRSAAVVAGTRRNPDASALMARLEQLAEELSRVGNNLNQIARQMNTTGELRNPANLDQALEVHDQIGALIVQAVERVITL